MNQPGIIYLIQPQKYLNTDIYKIGMSNKETIDRIKDYKKHTRVLSIYGCHNPLFFEKKLIKLFNEKFELYMGKEYFKIELKEKYLKKLFLTTVLELEIESEKLILKEMIIEEEKLDIKHHNYKCNKCNDTGMHKGDKENPCYNDIGNNTLCPAGNKYEFKLEYEAAVSADIKKLSQELDIKYHTKQLQHLNSIKNITN